VTTSYNRTAFYPKHLGSSTYGMAFLGR